MAARGLMIHGAILLVAAGLAVRTWTKDADEGPKHGETELWQGTPDQVQEIHYEAKQGELTLEPRRDTVGVYFIGTVKRSAAEPEKKAEPHAHPGEEPPPPPVAQEGKTGRFIATKDGEDLVKTLAPLRALRALGVVSDAQKAEFGLDKEVGKLQVKVAGKIHTLVFGGTTPGGSDYYATETESGKAYVVPGSIVRDLTSADQRLVERKLHGFEESAVKRIKLTAGAATRELVRSAEKKDAWTSPEAPNDKDETATNWMAKLERLRSTSYEGDALRPPAQASDLVLRVDYFDERKPLGYLEIIRRAGATPDKPEYVAKSEYTRWYATVVRSAAEQIEQDLKSVVSP